MNDLFYFIKNAKLLNVVDDNTITTFSNSVNDLITDLREESKMTRDWYYWYTGYYQKMVVNPDKFQLQLRGLKS